MKIDIEGLLQTKGRIDSGAVSKQTVKRDAASRTSGIEQSINIIQNISNARALIDAMAISQIAQNLMTRAIEISSKLRDIARSAISSGRINDKELQDAISDTKSSFNKLQETFSAPVISESRVNLGNIQKESNINIELPQLTKETALLGEVEAGLSGGRKPDNSDIKKIDIILDNLQNGSQLINNSYGQIKKLLDITGGEKIDYPNLISDILSGIAGKPDTALKSQGNINPDTAKFLLDNQIF